MVGKRAPRVWLPLASWTVRDSWGSTVAQGFSMVLFHSYPVFFTRTLYPKFRTLYQVCSANCSAINNLTLVFSRVLLFTLLSRRSTYAGACTRLPQ